MLNDKNHRGTGGKEGCKTEKRVHMENAGRRKKNLPYASLPAELLWQWQLFCCSPFPFRRERDVMQTPVSDVPVSSVKNEVSEKTESKESITSQNFLLENIFPNMDGLCFLPLLRWKSLLNQRKNLFM